MAAVPGPRSPGRPIERVGIVGAGIMGSGIAQVCLAAGRQVRLHDVSPVALVTARERIIDGLDRLVARERLGPRQRDAAEAALELVDGVDGLATLVDGADLVIEAAAEDLDVKEAVFRALDELAGPDVILATNTSSLSVADCASATSRPERVLGLHFFNPAPLMALVEVVAHGLVGRGVVGRATAFVEALGKTVVRCADSPGFVVNRVGRPYVLEGVRMLEAGEGSVAAIDTFLEAAGYPMGPFRLIDLIGLDVDLAIDDVLLEAFGADRFEAPSLQRDLAAAGRLGRKSGHGFYEWNDQGEAT